jgi:hypothetical protein
MQATGEVCAGAWERGGGIEVGLGGLQESSTGEEDMIYASRMGR